MTKLLAALALFSLFVFLCVLFFSPVETSDVWWHLGLGRYILHNASFPHTDIFSFFDQKAPWIFPQWAGSACFYALFQFFGLAGLKFFRALVFVGSLLLFVLYARKKIPLPLLIFLVFCMAYGLLSRFFVRPLIFNLIFIQIFLIVLFAHHKRGDRRFLFLLPLSCILWGNIHFGCFVYGGVLLSVFFLGAIVSPGQRAKAKDLGWVIVGFLASFFINPYGMRAAFYPLEIFFGPSFDVAFFHSHAINASVTEMMPPKSLFSYAYAWFFILLALAGLVIGSVKKNKFIYLVLVGISFFLFLYARRASDFFIFVVSYVLCEGAADLSLTSLWKNVFSKKFGMPLLLLSVLLCWIQIIPLFSRSVFHHGMRERYMSLDLAPGDPAAAIDFLKRQGIRGNVLNEEVFGGYILWAGYPELRPMVDTRWADRELFRAYVAIKTDPGRFMPWAQDAYDLKVAVIDTASATSQLLASYLDASPAWSLSFIDGSIFVYLRRGAYTLAASVEEFGVGLRKFRLRPEDVAQAGDVPRSGFLKGIKDYFFPEPFYIDTLEKGVSLFDLGYKDSGLRYIMEAQAVSDQKMTRGTMSYAVRAWREASASI